MQKSSGSRGDGEAGLSSCFENPLTKGETPHLLILEVLESLKERANEGCITQAQYKEIEELLVAMVTPYIIHWKG
jgi:hypothetical protein